MPGTLGHEYHHYALRDVAQLLTHLEHKASQKMYGNHIGRLLTACQWLDNMASDKYFNYIGL